MDLKQLVQKSVRDQIKEQLKPQNSKAITCIESQIVLESARSTVEHIVRSGIDKYKMMFLENGDIRYFVVDSQGRFEAVKFQGTNKAEKMTFGSPSELKEFIDTQINENGFKQVTRESGVKRFLKAITRGFGNLLTIIGVSGIAVGVLYLLFWLFPVDVAGAAYQLGDVAKGASGAASAGTSVIGDIASSVSGAVSSVAGEISTAYQTASTAITQGMNAADLAGSASPNNVGAGVDSAVAGTRSVSTVLTATPVTTGIIAGSLVGAGVLSVGAGGWVRVKAKKEKSLK